MKITLIGPVYPYRGGISQYHSQLAKALIDNNHEVQIISFKRQYPIWLYPGKTDKDPSPPTISIDATYILDPLDPTTWVKAIKEIKKFNPEKIIFQWWTSFWALAYTFLTNRLRGKVEITYLIHNVFPHERRFFDSFLAKLALRLGDSFIVLTQREKEKLSLLIPSAQNISVCSHPTYTMLNHLRISREQACQQLGLDSTTTIILFFGFIRPYKGLKYLVDAVYKLKNQGYNSFSLVIAGEFWEDPEIYVEQINQTGLEQNVVIHNRYISNEELAKFLSAADLFVAPYIGGTQSGTIKLAMGFNLPIVATEEIGTDLEESKYPNFILVPSKNSQALADAIKELHTMQSRVINKNFVTENHWAKTILEINKISKAN